MIDPLKNSEITIDDCWNKTGVWGTETPRCQKLDEFIHCRNCDVYSVAGRKMLERNLPDNYENSWAKIYAENKQTKIEHTESVTIFRLGYAWMALPTDVIQEVTDVCVVHSIPHRHNPVLRGLVNLRGQLRICVSLGHLMKIEKAKTLTGKNNKERIFIRMVAINHNNSQYVFLTSEVKGTYHYHPSQLIAPPATLSQATGTYTRGFLDWEGKDVACLDVDLMFYRLDKILT